MAEVFGKEEEAHPAEDHSPDAASHDILAAEDGGGSSANRALQHQPAFVPVHLNANLAPPGHWCCISQRREYRPRF